MLMKAPPPSRRDPFAPDPREDNGVVWVTERREQYFKITRRECEEPGEEGLWFESNWMQDRLTYGSQQDDGNFMMSCKNPEDDTDNYVSEVCVYGQGCPDEASREWMTQMAEEYGEIVAACYPCLPKTRDGRERERDGVTRVPVISNTGTLRTRNRH